MNTTELMELYNENILGTYDRFPYAFSSGKGAVLTDPEGREYVDFSSGIGVNSVGYADENWLSAINNQASKLQHISNLYYTEPGALLAKALKERSGFEGALFFSNSGAEANEGMLKLARKYSYDKWGEGRSNIVTLKNSFHGRTVLTLEATGQERFHNFFFPFTGGFTYAEAENLDSVKLASGGNSCAVLLELVQGEGGVMPLSKDFVLGVAAFCKENEMLLLIDEVQTGIGRTGTLFCFRQYGIKPDAVSFAKGIAGGLPMGGFMAASALTGVLGAGTHAATFGGNPVCCAAALSVLETLDDKVLDEVTKKGEYIKSFIKTLNSPKIVEVRGAGLMLGVRVKDITHRELVVKLLEAGLVALTAGADVVRFLPPLTISYAELDRGLAIFKTVMEAM